jgi:hypothetical protein
VDSRPLSEPTSGVYISGIGNVIRDSEIVYSSASNIVLEGTRNAIINCLVHKANYLGTWNALVRYDGIGHLISHNTLKNSGRSCIRPGGAEHLIQYNHISDPGMITHDLGCYHGGGNDGGNCIIRYNRFRGIAGKEYNGIYLDNYMHNFIIHHNVVSQTNDAIRLNRPTHYCVIAHNTVMEGITNRWGPWKGQMTQFGSLVVNNILGGPLMLNPEVVQARNLPVENIQTYFKGNTNIRQIPGSTDKGVFLPGINNKYTGEAPDAGAFETGENWQTGHDFASRPNPRYEKTQSFYRNYLKNASFEYSRYKTAFELEPLFAWQATGLKNATVEYFEGYNFPAANTRYAIHGNSVHLSGNGTDGIVQTVNDLKPNTEYTFAGYARLEGADDVVFRVTNTGTKPIQANTKAVPLEEEQKWHFVHLKFRTGPHNKKAIVAIEKVGSGDAYVDDCGVMPVADFSSK